LAYNGTADFFVIVFFGGFAVWGTVYALTLNPNIFPFYLGLQLGCLCNILLVVNNLRDQMQDVQNHKKTLIVRFGRGFGIGYYLTLILVGFFGLFLWPSEYFSYKFLLVSFPWFIFSLYFWNWVRKNKPSIIYNKILKFSSLTYFGFCLSLCIGFLVF
jgi:1,4-dihydroxy-2-naphthoate octaprenyltransferase